MTIKVKLAAIAKDESAYIPQWIHHHLSFGFDEIEIYLNNTTDNSEAMLNAIAGAYAPGVIKFKNVDALLKRCLAEKVPFQQQCYRELYSEALQDSSFTHAIFLDMDELWTPKDFSTSIKDFIRNSPEFDAISFQWAIDIPDQCRQVFSFPFTNVNTVQKNRHLKTLVRMTPRMKKLSIHNHIINNGVYLLPNKQRFGGSDKETIYKSLVPISYFEENKLSLCDDAFIFHQINRSPVEYLSSLLRGRGHMDDDRILKGNRNGYLADSKSGPHIDFKVNLNLLTKYYKSFREFNSATEANKFLDDAQQFIIDRFYSVVEHLRNDASLLIKYQAQLKGVKINDLLASPIISGHILLTIDKYYTRQVDSRFVIEGWAFDPLSTSKLAITVFNTINCNINFEIEWFRRADVARVYPDSDFLSGFKLILLEFNPTSVDDIESKWIELSFSGSSGVKKVKVKLSKTSR